MSALVVLLGVALLLGACTTARVRDEPSNIVGNLRYRDAEAKEIFRETFRSGNLYVDFRPVLIVDAIFLDERYRRHFLRTLRDRYYIEEKDLDAMALDEQERFDNGFEFLVLIYGGSNKPVRLERKDVNWKLLLRDDDGDLLRPSEIEGIHPDSPVYRYVDLHFEGLDRWSRLYRVSFPKFEKTLRGSPPGPHPFEMLVTGIEGSVTMRWTDASLFYRTARGVRPEPREDVRAGGDPLTSR